MNLGPINYIAQKLLYLWIRTDIVRIDATDSPETKCITIYVLESRSWSDLLVLEHECKSLKKVRPRSRIKHAVLKRWHHVYTVAQAQPLKAWIQNTPKHSRMLSGIYQALQQDEKLDIRFVPVVVFWGRPVLKQKHWLRVLFSDTWGFAGRTRRLLTILFNGKNTLLQFSPAISFRNQLPEGTSQDEAVDLIQQLLSDRLNEIKTATLGPDISHRRTLVRKLLKNEAITRAIHHRCQQDQISELKAYKIAHKYLNEIVADRSYITIQILQRVLTAFWNKFYSGIKVHFSQELKQLALSHELVYVPCHRSHIDYLLLSYVIHSEGLAIPYIAAGKNLNMPLIGPVLRKGGAFFIRRSFKGNELYSTALFEYLASQIATAMPLEYFVEGGRSRTGRLLQPKPGMLAMTARAYLKYRQRPIAFIPVYIGYEKMIEGKAYLAELKGDDKKSETLLGSVRSFLGIRGFYGKVTTNFGKPIFLNDILGKHQPGWATLPYDEHQRPEWFMQAINHVSHNIMRNINAACSVNTVNLISTALLASPNQTMDEGQLCTTLKLYTRLIEALKYSDRITVSHKSPAEQIKHAEQLGLVRRQQHTLGDFLYLDNAHAILLTYYRNNILHLFALPSLVACCFINNHTLSFDRVLRYISLVHPFLKNEFFLPWSIKNIDKIVSELLQFLHQQELLSFNEASGEYSRPPISTEQHTQLTSLARVISPLLELYYMIFALLAEHEANSLDRNKLEELCHLMAQRYSLMYEINSPDFFDKKLIANFINSLIELGYVQLNETGLLSLGQQALTEGIHARRLLDKNLQYNILQMLNAATNS